jgi:addiction module HigA family antidote
MKKRKKLAPIHPGEVLAQEFLAPLALSQYRLAKDIHVPPRRINEIVQGGRAISADTALRLSRYFGTTAKFWLNLQAQYDLDVQEEKIFSDLESGIKPFRQAA